MTREEIMWLLKDISQSSNQWSIVYNMDKGDIDLAIGRKYKDVKHYRLDIK